MALGDAVSGTETLASGVAALGMKDELRDGVNGAEVGTIREVGLEGVSSRMGGGGWPCGSCMPISSPGGGLGGGPKPGGIEGVEDREPPI